MVSRFLPSTQSKPGIVFKPKPPGYVPPGPTKLAERNLEKIVVSVVLVSDAEKLGYIEDLKHFINTQLCGQLTVEEIKVETLEMAAAPRECPGPENAEGKTGSTLLPGHDTLRCETGSPE
jgi:hypothetical protein